jgi:cation:H+ antiporter
MVLIWDIFLFALGIGLLVKGADWLVDAAARVAKQFGVSSFIIGVTIVALGTSLPELGAAAMGSFHGNSGLVLGDIIGSNIANLALVLGLAGLFVPIGLKRNLYRRDGMLMLFSTVLFYFLCLDGIFTAWEGGLFLFMFIAYLLYFLAAKQKYKGELHFRRYLSEYADVKKKQKFEKVPPITKSVKKALHQHLIEKAAALAQDFDRLWRRTREAFDRNRKFVKRKRVAFAFFLKQLALLSIGVICIFVGAEFVVSSAMRFPVNQVIVGMVFVAIGTSLPELLVTISTLRKGLPQIMIGNLVGSNIANLLWVGGISALINPIAIPESAIRIDFVFLIWTTWMFLVFLRNDRKISRIESLTLVCLYLLLLATTFGLRLGPGFGLFGGG